MRVAEYRCRYIQKDTRWRNKQRTLVFCSRGVTARPGHSEAESRRPAMGPTLSGVFVVWLVLTEGFAICATTFASFCPTTNPSPLQNSRLKRRAVSLPCALVYDCQEPKFEKRSNFNEINEAWIHDMGECYSWPPAKLMQICELKNCNNVVFFEARKREDLCA